MRLQIDSSCGLILKLLSAPSRPMSPRRAPRIQGHASFLAGLPPDHSFFVTVELRDGSGSMEHVFVAVDRIQYGLVYGRIWNKVHVVKGYSFRQAYTSPEAELLDWTITKPDGTEEGNFVGKYIDALDEKKPR
jgi:hypothetical protein